MALKEHVEFWKTRVERLEQLVQNIQDALGTAERGQALVEVARNAHRAEQKMAAQDRSDRS